ncbi:relaxase/mobilization nuclease domain-containing protein [Pedobacter sp. GR22-6]|uniref:relaxase/mobilization nuclease domain-containing protein n=1 Tax=Pedobacter sp. GR22-6 TaxID=3127957 RepID=UPI00307DAE72
MIVKFLVKSKTFKGVRYNTNKVEKNKGELMKVSGFGILQGMSQLMPQDYINYLQSISSRNKQVIYPQLHVVISAKGKENSKEELTGIADKWMLAMGYADQPYLVIFHKDTRNHHVHIVSSRVDKFSGKKISSTYEKVRAQTAMNRIMRLDEKLTAKADLDKAMKFNFQTKAQFMMILESKGYSVAESSGKMFLSKFGTNLLDFDPSFLKERKSNYVVNQSRASQITALIHKFRKQYSAVLRLDTIPCPGKTGKISDTYTSDLAVHLKKTFGIQLLFHAAEGKTPYGYSIVDHADGNVFKGGEIMDIAELLDGNAKDLSSSAAHQIKDKESIDHAIIESSDQALTNSSPQQLNGSSDQQQGNEEAFDACSQSIRIDISDDIDDEAIHGRNRQRKRQARTNKR